MNSKQVVAVLRSRDNGPGMTLERMVDAARAGYSHNSPVDNLGLFGMGFNIATARLGRTTQLRSGVAGEDRWCRSCSEWPVRTPLREGRARARPVVNWA